MSKYTTELRHVCTLFTREVVESWFSSYKLEDYLTEYEVSVINERGTWNKEKLAHKIVNHYYMREIGLETPALFREYAKIFMEEIMEEYLPLIYSASIYYDPLINVNFTEDYTRTIDNDKTNSGTIKNAGTNTSNSTASATGLNISSDTPQGQINKASILAGNYATSTEGSESSSNGTDTTNINNTQTNNLNMTDDTLEKYSKKTIGNSGVSATSQKMIEQYRDNIRAIDREIIERLSELFMGLY